MKHGMTIPASRCLRAGVILLSLLVGACSSIDRNVAMTTEAVSPIVSGEPTDVSAANLAEAMVRAGFSPDFILEHGPAIRNALASSGGVRVRDKGVIAALMSIQAGKLYVTSRQRGTFVQSLEPVS